jgi:hypothetical protein
LASFKEPTVAKQIELLEQQLADVTRDASAAIALRDARIKELEAHTPTQWAYDAACKALAHWRKEAKRLGRIAKVTPRDLPKSAT